MKLLLLILLFPTLGRCQFVQVNRTDPFTKSKSVTTKPVEFKPDGFTSIQFSLSDSNYSIQFNSYALVPSRTYITQANDRLLILLDNSEVITATSPQLQDNIAGGYYPKYSRIYSIAPDAIAEISKHQIVGFREYEGAKSYDVEVSKKKYQDRLQQAATEFLNACK